MNVPPWAPEKTLSSIDASHVLEEAIDVERIFPDELRGEDRRQVVASHDRVGAFPVSDDALIGFDLDEHAPLRTHGERRRDLGDFEVARFRRD